MSPAVVIRKNLSACDELWYSSFRETSDGGAVPRKLVYAGTRGRRHGLGGGCSTFFIREGGGQKDDQSYADSQADKGGKRPKDRSID